MKFCLLFTTLLCISALGADNPSAGVWKMNVALSSLQACSPHVAQNKTLTIPADVAAMSPRSAAPRKQSGMPDVTPVRVQSALSPDKRMLTLSQMDAPSCKLVYDRE